MMHGHEKSDPAVVAGKPANKAERSAAELVEPRAGTKGNVDQLSTRRTSEPDKRDLGVGSHTATNCRQYPRWEPYAGKPHVRICAGGARQLVSLPQNGRQPAPTADVSFPTWKAEAVKALAKLPARAAVAMRERDWRNLYVRGLGPDDAASYAARDDAASHRPEWAKGRR